MSRQQRESVASLNVAKHVHDELQQAAAQMDKLAT